MEASDKTIIEVETLLHLPLEKVWAFFTLPVHITKWNHASDDWHSPRAENDLRPGGKFNYRMEAVDGSIGFDFEGVYDDVKTHQLISYILGDNRRVITTFVGNDRQTVVKTQFEAENENSPEQQKEGWQAILNNFKKYAEGRDFMEQE